MSEETQNTPEKKKSKRIIEQGADGVRYAITAFGKLDGIKPQGRVRMCRAKNNTCEYPAIKGTEHCKGHTPPSLKTGALSNILKGTLKERYERYLTVGLGKENEEAQALLQVMIESEAAKLQDNAHLWNEAKTAFNDLKKALSMRPSDDTDLQAFQEKQSNLIKLAINDLELALLNGGTNSDVSVEIRKNADLQTKIKERQMRENVMTHGMVKLDELIVMLARNRALIDKYVPVERRNDFEKEFEQTMRMGGMSNVIDYTEMRAQ
jgi:hypothetical protein